MTIPPGNAEADCFADADEDIVTCTDDFDCPCPYLKDAPSHPVYVDPQADAPILADVVLTRLSQPNFYLWRAQTMTGRVYFTKGMGRDCFESLWSDDRPLERIRDELNEVGVTLGVSPPRERREEERA